MSLFSVVRGYNIFLIVVAQYLAAVFIFSPDKSLRYILLDINLYLIVLSTICVVAAGYIINDYFDVKADELNNLVLQSSEGDMKNIVGYNNLPLVSIDFNHSSYSSVFDESLTRASDDKLYKICAWYDNEWGFSNRMLDVTMHWVN